MTQRPVPYEQLIEYAAGEAPAESHEAIASYLAANPDAAGVVARYRAAMEAMRDNGQYIAPAEVVERAKAVFDPEAIAQAASRSTSASWWERLQQLVASLVYDNRVLPATAGVRGHGGSVQLSYQCDAADLDLSAEPINPSDVEGSQTKWRLVGQVAVDAPKAIRIAVFEPDAIDIPLCELTTNERGAFSVELDPGRYELRIAMDDEQIVVRDVEIP